MCLVTFLGFTKPFLFLGVVRYKYSCVMYLIILSASYTCACWCKIWFFSKLRNDTFKNWVMLQLYNSHTLVYSSFYKVKTIILNSGTWTLRNSYLHVIGQNWWIFAPRCNALSHQNWWILHQGTGYNALIFQNLRLTVQHVFLYCWFSKQFHLALL